jgi:hypothetical protein
MSIETALIGQAHPFMVAARANALIREEQVKGCQPEISLVPVALEPHFQPLWNTNKDLNIGQGQPWILEDPPLRDELVRLQVWISPEHKFDWIRSELFIKQLQGISSRAGFEVVGNNKGITIALLSHRSDTPIITAAFRGQFEFCELTAMDDKVLSGPSGKEWADGVFRDYFPAPPYSHLLTRPSELQLSPLTSLITVMSAIEAPAIGLYQALFQAVRPKNNWHRNVQTLLDFEYTMKLMAGFQIPQRYAQQAPSGDLRQMAWEVENKAHNDKPFFAMAFRVAVIGGGEKGGNLLSSLSTFPSLFQHGGRPLGYLTEKDYEGILTPKQTRDMFLLGLTYRPGFLVNSSELTGPVHVLPVPIAERRHKPMEDLETLPVRNPDLLSGTWIGTCSYAGETQRVCIPPLPRRAHTHLIGKSGVGKSTTQEHMILSDIEEGHGVAVLDPHGDLVERLLCLIPERYVERTIYLNPGDPEWVPIWNPLERILGQDIGRTAEDIVTAIKSFVTKGSWGDRLENILRHIIFSLFHLPQSTFLDMSDLLRNTSKESKILRGRILNVLDNEVARQFWLSDYEKYGKDDFGPPRNKLSKLLVSGSVSLMLSQPESRFNFRQIMDEGMIFLVNLSAIGPMVREILGSFILSMLHLTALSRSQQPIANRKQFHIHCDEAHRFLTDALEDLLVETRKYACSLSLAHQYISQFGQSKTDALSSVGSTIIFNVDSRDATYLIKDLRGLVGVDDLTSLERGNAIARIGTDIIRMETRGPLPIPDPNFRDRIIEESRRKYYKPVDEVKEWIRHRNQRWCQPFSPLAPGPGDKTQGDVKELVYDEF